MRIKAIVASTYNDTENGWSYTEPALGSLVNSAIGKPVIFQKKNIGQVESAFVKSNKAIVEAEINIDEDLLIKKLYLVPGGLTDYDTKDNKIWTCVAHQFFLTEIVSDKELRTIETVKI